jgi:hypothetical protein
MKAAMKDPGSRSLGGQQPELLSESEAHRAETLSETSLMVLCPRVKSAIWWAHRYVVATACPSRGTGTRR